MPVRQGSAQHCYERGIRWVRRGTSDPGCRAPFPCWQRPRGPDPHPIPDHPEASRRPAGCSPQPWPRFGCRLSRRSGGTGLAPRSRPPPGRASRRDVPGEDRDRPAGRCLSSKPRDDPGKDPRIAPPLPAIVRRVVQGASPGPSRHRGPLRSTLPKTRLSSTHGIRRPSATYPSAVPFEPRSANGNRSRLASGFGSLSQPREPQVFGEVGGYTNCDLSHRPALADRSAVVGCRSRQTGWDRISRVSGSGNRPSECSRIRMPTSRA